MPDVLIKPLIAYICFILVFILIVIFEKKVKNKEKEKYREGLLYAFKLIILNVLIIFPSLVLILYSVGGIK